MNVLSLFDGMSCGQIALKKLGIKVDNYFACEIDKYAIKVTMDNFPDTKQLGDVTKVDFKSLPKIDLLIGGSPCQGFSFAGKQLNFNDPRSALFFEYVRALKETQPKYYLLENVRMKKEYQDVISQHLGVEPILINSALVSAQNRNRLYWTNIPSVTQPEDKKVYLKDIIENGSTDREKSYCLDANYFKGISSIEEYQKKCRRQIIFCSSEIQVLKEGRTEKGKQSRRDIRKLTGKDSTIRSDDHKCYFGREGLKSNCIVTGLGIEGMIVLKDKIRKLTVQECKRLQTVPDDYLMNVSNTQAYKMLGNGWTVDVIAHILKGIINE